MLHKHDTNHTRTQQANPALTGYPREAFTCLCACLIVCIHIHELCVYIYTCIVCIHIHILCIHTLHRHNTNHTCTQQANPAQAAQAYGAMTAAIQGDMSGQSVPLPVGPAAAAAAPKCNVGQSPCAIPACSKVGGGCWVSDMMSPTGWTCQCFPKPPPVCMLVYVFMYVCGYLSQCEVEHHARTS